MIDTLVRAVKTYKRLNYHLVYMLKDMVVISKVSESSRALNKKSQ